MTRIKVKKFRKTGEEFKKFLERRKVGPLIRLDIVYHSSKVNEFDKDDIYSMLHLLHPKRKNIKPASKYPAFHLRVSPLVRTAIFFSFLDFVALTPMIISRIKNSVSQKIENPLLFFNVALNLVSNVHRYSTP